MRVKEWIGEVFLDTSFNRESLGVVKNKMTLKPIKRQFVIEWIIGEDDIHEIGILVEENKVTDFDGVFELPKEAIELLKENGFDTSEVER
jgi:hypothetical protein